MVVVVLVATVVAVGVVLFVLAVAVPDLVGVAGLYPVPDCLV